MARYSETELVPTILDRLVPPEESSGGIGSRSRNDVDEFAASIARDLRVLLNTRREENQVPPEFVETATSIVNFGIPDFTKCGGLRSTAEQFRLRKWMEEAIRNFESRLQNVSVRVIDSENANLMLRF